MVARKDWHKAAILNISFNQFNMAKGMKDG